MPQIRCPNCGTSINLENRRELDYKTILSVIQKGSSTFTELLKNTGLPRKTLSMRLSALCDSGIIVKDGGYRLNGTVQLGKWGKIMDSTENQPLGKTSFFTKRNILITMMLLVIAVPIAANVFATLINSPPPPQQAPLYIGTFKAYVKVTDVTDLFAWQAVINVDSSQLVVVDAVRGDFLKAKAPDGTTFQWADETTNPDTPNILLVGDSLLGMDIEGVSGTGTLAIITFGYKTKSYALPEILYGPDHVFETALLDSNLAYIQGYTLTLEI